MSIRRLAMTAVIGAALWAAWACGGDSDNDSGELRDADEARSAEASATAADAKQGAVALGTRVELNNGVAVTVRSAKPATDIAGRKPSDPHASWLTLDVIIENTSNTEQPPPDFAVVCPGGTGARYSDDSATALSMKPLPSKSQDDGTLLMGVPANCARGTVTAKATGVISGSQRLGAWQLP